MRTGPFTRCILCTALLAPFCTATAQLRNANWVLGAQEHIRFLDNVPTFESAPHAGGWACAALSDVSGNLLVYALNEVIYNAADDTIANCPNLPALSSFSQPWLFLPWPGHPSGVLLFRNETSMWAGNVNPGRFGYALIDMDLDGGAGAVVGGFTWLSDSATSKLTAVPHANGEDYWVLTQPFGTDEIAAYRLSADGVDSVPVIAHVGQPLEQTVDGISYGLRDGAMVASYPGDRLALCAFPSSYFGYGLDPCIIEVLRFDAATGSAELVATIPSPMGTTVDGMEFSPDGSKLYFVTTDMPSSSFTIHQYDLSNFDQAAIVASHYEVLNVPFTSVFGDPELQLILAPDGQIYFHNEFSSNWLGVIASPDLPDAACDVIDHFLEFPNPPATGFPNQCRRYQDSELVAGLAPAPRDQLITPWPDPVRDHVHFPLPGAQGTSGMLIVRDGSGRALLSVAVPAHALATSVDVDMSGLPTGDYILCYTNGSSAPIHARVSRL